MPAFKYAIFAFETLTLPEELRLISLIGDEWLKLPKGQETFFQFVRSLEEVPGEITHFKSKTCGSAYNLALINLNQFPSAEELNFLLGSGVLGDPRTVFMVSLKTHQAAVYAIAREKVEREALAGQAGRYLGAPSCINAYASHNRQEAAGLVVELLNAYLDEEEMRIKARRTGSPMLLALSPATDVMRRSRTVFYGRQPSTRTSVVVPEGETGKGSASSSGRTTPLPLPGNTP